MRFKSFYSIVLIFFILFSAEGLFAQTSKDGESLSAKDASTFTLVQFSFFAPLQLFSEADDVYGFRLSLPYGSNEDLMGLDLGFVNKLDSLYGVGLNVLYSQRSHFMYGVNLSGFFNLSKGEDVGLSCAGFYNKVAAINGLQMAFLCNEAKKVDGMQIGLCNYCEKMNGVQIGIFNYCKDQPFKCTFFFNFWDSSTVAKRK